ncbi:uncharacterized protein VTP21DRAFT_6135 [Calcarisporiella thermophila]|uniref:uncharacterized protein n=1 Tax=Calcarisporiella thermophila TaxID=911321 RepID=UPI003743EBB3
MHYIIISKTRNTVFGDFTGRAKAILTGIQGILNLIIFLFNPTFTSALKEFFINKPVGFPSKSQSVSYASTRMNGVDTIPHFGSWIWKQSASKLDPICENMSPTSKRVKFANVPEMKKGKMSNIGDALQSNPSITVTSDQKQFVFSPTDIPESQPNDRNKWIMGRRFCADLGIHYILPNDEEEIDRLISQHFFFRSLFSNRNFLSPVQDILRDGAMVLDLGCGPGTWIMEMATEFPRSQFHGIDICDLFPQQIRPDNCHFQVANILKGLPFENALFDFIYIRCVSLAVFQSEWAGVITEILRVLKPGGYLEFVEADYAIQCEGKSLQKIADGIYNSLRARDIHPSWTRRIGEYLRSISVEDISSLSQPFLASIFSGKDGERGVVYWMQFLSALKPHLAQVMYISSEEYDELQQCICRELSTERIQIDVVCTYGRKSGYIDQAEENEDQIEIYSDG